MKKSLVVALLVLGGLVGTPSKAEADITSFSACTSSPHTQSVRGGRVRRQPARRRVRVRVRTHTRRYEVGEEAPGLQTGMATSW
jgi:hypothetical protein